MKLFQYWDTGEPPDEVAGWIEGFRVMNPEMQHRLYDRDSASWFIGKHLGERERLAFDACAVPAMQADYFRLCALFAKGGLWVDADTKAVAPMARWLDRAPRSLMPQFDGFFGTMVMLFRRPGDPFLHALLGIATQNIEERRFSSALIATGPILADALRGVLDPEWALRALVGDTHLIQTRRGLIDHVRARMDVSAQVLDAYRAITIQDVVGMAEVVQFQDAIYKKTPRHWANWRGSIYLTV